MNLFKHSIPEFGEDFYTLFEDNNLKISKIVSSNKLEKKEYCQKESEFVALLDGEATLEIEGKEITLKKGDTLYIPSFTKHKVLKTSNGALWLAIYFNTNKLS